MSGFRNPEVKVFKFNINGEFIEEYSSTSKAGYQNKISQCSISNCCRGRQKSAGGYIWKYESHKKQ